MVKKRDGNEQRHVGPKSDKLWANAIRRAVLRTMQDKKTQRIDALAGVLVANGFKGDNSALKEIGDRLDGKSVQGIDLAPTAEGLEALLDRFIT